MKSNTKKSTDGTSFFGDTIPATVNTLVNLIGPPDHVDNSGDDKTTHEWNCETNDGTVFTLYDWKSYRAISPEEIIHFHIGAFSESDSKKVFNELIPLVFDL